MFLYDNQWKFFNTLIHFSKKLEYRFLVETTKIENTLFLFKTLPESNVKTNRMAGDYKLDLSQRVEFCINCFFFFGKFASVLELTLKKS